MKNLCLLLITLFASQKICSVEINTSEKTKVSRERYPLASLTSSVIDKHQNIINNLFLNKS